MKDINEIIKQFDNIEELPVSEEMLGAYVEGKLKSDEVMYIEQQLHDYDKLEFLIEKFSVPDVISLKYTGMDILSEEDNSSFVELPEVVENLEYFINEFDDILQEEYNVGEYFAENGLINNDLNIEIMEEKTIIYGQSGQNVFDPVYVQQPDDHSCALRSQQIILRDFGIDIPFKDLEQIAKDHGVYTDEGTYTYDVGKVLQIAGVGMHQTVGNTIDDLIHELVQGHRVIVSVDADELWHHNTMAQQMRNWFNDAIGQGGNHALIVAGVEVNIANPKLSKVILTDPGDGHLRIEYPMEQFKSAWGDSNCFMAATNEAAPYQYDVSTGKEVPSNFAVQQYVNEFVKNNSYQLSPDFISVPEGYSPAFTGHIDVVGDMDYDSYKSNYDSIIANRLPSELSVKEQIEEMVKHEKMEPSADGLVCNNNNDNVEIVNNSVGSENTLSQEQLDSELDDVNTYDEYEDCGADILEYDSDEHDDVDSDENAYDEVNEE